MKHIKLYEDFINEAIDLKDAKDYLEKRGNEFQEQQNDHVEFYSEEYDANIFVYKNVNFNNIKNIFESEVKMGRNEIIFSSEKVL